MDFGTKIRKLRQDMGWTQQELADEVGIAHSYISRLEREDHHKPSADILLRLARALKVDVAELYQVAGYIGETGNKGQRPLKSILREAQERCELLETIEVPIRGKVPATYPDPNGEAYSHVLIPKELLPMAKGELFAFQVTSDCLVEAGIHPGDYIIIDPEAALVDGQIYVGRVGDRVVVERVYLVGNKLRLHSGGGYEERDMAEVEIWGRVVLTGHWKAL